MTGLRKKRTMMFLAFSSSIILAGMVLIITMFLIIAEARKADFGLVLLSDPRTIRRAAVLSAVGLDTASRPPGHQSSREAET